MTGLEALLFAVVAAQQGQVRIVVHGRDPMTLADSGHVIRGTCDGREASATIEMAVRGRVGRLTLRAGRHIQQLPSGFLEGRLFAGSFYAAGLGCDGRSIIFRARVARMEAEGRVNIQVQSATMDMRTGRLSISEVRTLDQDEVRLELR